MKLKKIVCQVNNSTPVVLARIANITPTVFSHLKLKTKIISQQNQKSGIPKQPREYFYVPTKLF
ncbi:WxL protein host-binding domain-containing protein [Lactiplantibacillus plantarum]|uniref:WxL protein host-binding domain-containing protein n=1 Tax=Lactiplantibacillus plantarum TaxID=1590 RepID=UPI003C6CCED5